MFTHIYRYRLLRLIRDKELFFWTLLFPVILGTLFFATFGNYMKRGEAFQAVPVAYVEEGSYSYKEAFDTFLDQISDADGILSVSRMKEREALDALESGAVSAVIQADSEVRLVLGTEGVEQSIVKTVLDTYIRMEGAIAEIALSPAAMENPAILAEIMEQMSADVSYNQETLLGDENQDSMLQYFYALLAMACLYSAFYGLTNAMDIQANISALGARRGVTPVHKVKIVLGEYLAGLTMQMASMLILLFYLTIILGISFGSQIPYILLTCLVGSMLGIAYGTFVGAAVKSGEGLKVGILTGSTMVMCFLSGLMFNTMKQMVEHSIPILNRVNPAVLLSDAFYALNVYESHERYFTNLAILVFMTAVLLAANYFIIRRNRYASL